MSIVLPKPWRVLGLPELTLVELNDIDVDRMLPHLWELIVKQGRTSGSRTDERGFERYVEQLQKHPDLRGFEDRDGARILSGWLQASVVRMGRKGLRRQESAMDFVLPLTIASYRAGLPKTRTRHRYADELTFRLMADEVERRGAKAALPELHGALRNALGRGVEIGPAPQWSPQYDGKSEIDVTALLSLYFLEGFEAVDAKDSKRDDRVPPLDGPARPIGRDLVAHLWGYGSVLGDSDFVSQVTSILSLRLFQLPLRTALATRHLVTEGRFPVGEGDAVAPNPLELYCDFTGQRASVSDRLSAESVQRDLDILRGFLRDRLFLRVLFEAIKVTGHQSQLSELSPAARFEAAVALARDPHIEAFAAVALQSIRHETENAGNDEGVDELDVLLGSDRSRVDVLAGVLTSALKSRGLENQVKWFWSTGGIQKRYGLLRGTLKSRRSWRYAPTEELLHALLHACFLEDGGRRVRPELPLQELLDRLQSRFGLLIDRPPSVNDSADARAAAALNLQAFKLRLQLLGCFDSLSDDFSAQYVRRPTGDPVA